MKAKQTTHRLLAMLLCLAMLLSMAPALQLFSWVQASGTATTCCEDHDHTHEGWQELPATGAALQGNYYVKDDMTLTGTIETSGDVHICLNGKTISYTGDAQYIIKSSNNWTVTICDCVGGGGIDASGTTGTAASSIFNVQATSTLNVYGGTFTGRTSTAEAGAVGVAGTFYMYGGTITGNSCTAGPGGVFVEGGTFTMKGGSITDNSGNYGGAIYVKGGSATIDGGSITDNTVVYRAWVSGAAAYVCENGTLTINGGTISGNKLDEAALPEGGSWSYPNTIDVEGGNFVMTGGSISCTTDNGVILRNGVTNTYAISGSARIDEAGFRLRDTASSTGTIGNLKADASVWVKKYQLTVPEDDKTVIVSGEAEGPWHYTGKDMAACCEDHDRTHEGWQELPAVHGDSDALEGNYYVKDDMDLTGMIQTNGDVHICLNGKTINYTGSSKYILEVYNGVTVTICDCKGGGKLDATNATGTEGKSIFNVRATATLNIYGGTFTGRTSNGKAGCVSTSGVFNMYGGEISGNTYTNDDGYGGAVFVDSGAAFNMEGGTITGNEAKRGGAVYASGGTILISGGTISGNTSTDTDRPQEIYMTSSSKLNFTGAPVFEGVTVRYGTSDTSDISNLEPGASIILPTGYATADVTVGAEEDAETGLTHYTYKEPPVGGDEGESDIRVLSIGNSYSRDVMYYLGRLGKLAGKDIMAAYLYKGSATIRDHAYNLAHEEKAYSYYKTDLETGKLVGITTASIQQALDDGQWDVILLHQGTVSVGFPTTYNSDLEYLIDYINAEQPDAAIDWMMTWAFQDNYSSEDFETFYNSDQNTMYNGIIRTLEECIVDENADFAGDFRAYIPVGAALQNLRATYGDTLTRDGYHLSLEAGRLTAAMTLLQSLYPEDTDLLDSITVSNLTGILEEHDMNGDTSLSDVADAYENTEANLALVKAAVEAACTVAATGEAPEKLPTPPANTNTEEGVITVAQVDAPLSLFFGPLASLKDGTLIAAAYESSVHVPTYNFGGMQEGPGRIYVFEGSVDGQTWSYDEPLLTIDEKYLHDKGIVSLYNRYDLLQANPGTNACVFADPRDPNLLTIYMDMDGDGEKEEVLTLTFWVRFMADNGDYYDSAWTYLVHSTDGGVTWSDPFEIKSGLTDMTQTLKRGTIAYFGDDRQIMVPYYADYMAGAVLLEWDLNAKTWVKVDENYIPNTSPDEGKFNEIALVAPNEDDLVYAYVRVSGAVLKSEDRGKTWVEVANEEGTINQPGFVRLDEDRVFTTWAVPNPGYSRDIYGKVFYANGDWNNSASNLIYMSPVRTDHDAGDPSAAVMKDGKVFVVAYDTVYRSMLGMIVDPADNQWQPIELQNTPQSQIFSQSYNDQALSAGVALPEELPNNYTIEMEVKFTSESAVVSIPTAAGTVTVTPNKVTCGKETAVALALNTTTAIRVSVVGSTVYVKVWQGTEPTAWTLVGGDAASQTQTVTGTDALLTKLDISRKIIITLRETLEGMECTSTTVLQDYKIQPADYKQITFTSSKPAIVKVDNTGVVSFVSPGTATITMDVDGVTATCLVTVHEGPIEITGKGETEILLQDDYESYSVDDDAFWNDYWKAPENSLYEMRYKVQSATDTTNKGTGVYSIREENGNKYLELTGKTWHTTKLDIVGDYTVQYDFKMNTEVKDTGVNITMWQRSNDDPAAPNQVHMFVNMDTHHFRLNYRAERLDVDSSTDTNPNIYDPTAGYFYGDYNALEWCTLKMVRLDGYFYVKVWNKYDAEGNEVQEPEAWTLIFEHEVLDTDVVSNLRISLSAGDLLMDNLLITQQVEVPSAVEATRMELDNSLNMQFAVPMDQQTDWTGYKAVVKHTYADDSINEIEIPSSQWSKDEENNYLVISYNGVAAKEMTDEVTVTIYDKDGKQVGASYTKSVRKYAMEILADVDEKDAWKLMVDMLNYGAAAQEFFGYKTDDLANAELTEDQQDLATQGKVDVTSEAMSGTISRLNLESRIELQIVIPEAYKGQTIRYSFTNHYYETVEGTPEIKVDAAKGYSYIAIDKIVVADANQMVSVFAGDTKIAEDSVASYIARMDGSDSTTDPLYQSIMKFANAAKEYFALNNIGEE